MIASDLRFMHQRRSTEALRNGERQANPGWFNHLGNERGWRDGEDFNELAPHQYPRCLLPTTLHLTRSFAEILSESGEENCACAIPTYFLNTIIEINHLQQLTPSFSIVLARDPVIR